MYLRNTSSNAVIYEQQRSNIYVYNSAPFAAHRRQRIASDNIRKVQNVAASIGAHVSVVQANYEYETAIALCNRLGLLESVLHLGTPAVPIH